jgi:hypothetical protein
MLIEKAWAKTFGNYEITEGGMPADVLNVLTGAPCIDLETEDTNFISLIQKYNDNNYVITGACHNQQLSQSKF